MLNLKRNMFLNSLVIFMIGIRYSGALHLWSCFTTVFLQIFCSSAAFISIRKVQSTLIFVVK